MAMSQQAYDLSRYEPKQKAPEMKVVKRAQPIKSLYGVRPITFLAIAIAVIAITATLLYNNAMIAEISAEITAVSDDLELLQNENARLSRELDAKISNESLAKTAENELGLNKLENYQVEYVNLSATDVVTAKDTQSGAGVFAMIGQAVTEIQEYLKF